MVVYVNCKQISAREIIHKKMESEHKMATAAKTETNVIIKMGIKITNDICTNVERGWIEDSILLVCLDFTENLIAFNTFQYLWHKY